MTVQVGNPSFLYEEMLDDYEDTNIDPDLNSLREGKVTGSQRTRPPLGNSPHPSHCSLILAHGGGGGGGGGSFVPLRPMCALSQPVFTNLTKQIMISIKFFFRLQPSPTLSTNLFTAQKPVWVRRCSAIKTPQKWSSAGAKRTFQTPYTKPC